jgi:hypothetical protein
MAAIKNPASEEAGYSNWAAPNAEPLFRAGLQQR